MLAPLNRETSFPYARHWVQQGAVGRPIQPHTLERPGEPRLQEPTQLGSGLELRNRVQFLECRRERIRETPNRSRPEFLILRLEVEVVYGPCQVFRNLQFAPPRMLRR